MTSLPVKRLPVSARWLPEGFAEAGFDGNVEFRAAFDSRGEGAGIGGLALLFWLRGPLGAVSWELLTGCFLPETQTKWIDRSCLNGNKPSAGAVDWHSPVPLYDGQEPRLDCLLLGPGVPCYGDSGYLLGDEAYKALAGGAEAALWLFLREKYDDKFAEEIGQNKP